MTGIQTAQHLLPGQIRPHPRPAQYVQIAVVLCILTALEISLYYMEDQKVFGFRMTPGPVITLLIIFAAIKFLLVISWYMHLRTDAVLFRKFFALGFFGALTLYIIVLLTFSQR